MRKEIITTIAMFLLIGIASADEISAHWEGNVDTNPRTTLGIDFQLVAPGWQTVNFTIDGIPDGSQKLYGKTGVFYDGKYSFSTSRLYTTYQAHIVCINSACTTLSAGTKNSFWQG